MSIPKPVLFAALIAATAAPYAAAQPPANVWSPIGPQFSTVLALERNPASAGELLAGTYFGGLYRSADYGFSWTHVQAEFSSRSIFAIAYAGNGTIYVGTFQGGVYRSTDGGTTWTAVNSGLTVRDVQALAADPHNGNVVLAGTSSGVFRSEDGGTSWTLVGDAGASLRAKAIAFHPAEPGLVYAGTIGQGVFRSADGGQTFEAFGAGMTAASVFSLRFGAAPSRELYAATDNGAFKLRAGTTTWSNLTGNLPQYPLSDLYPHPVYPNMVFAGTFVGVFVLSDDNSSTAWVSWTDQPTRLITADPSGSVFHLGGIHGDLKATTDFGSSWYQASWGIQNLFVGALAVVDGGAAGPVVFAGSDSAVHRNVSNGWAAFFDQKQGIFDIQPDPVTPGTLYIGTERAGVWKSTDWGTSWQGAADNLVPSQIFSLGQSADGRTLYAGTSSGLYMSADNGDKWLLANDAQLGIVLSLAPDPTRHPFLFVGSANGQVLRSENGGWSFASRSNGLPAENIVSLVTAPWEKTYAITAGGGLFATSDNGQYWFAAADGVGAPAAAIAPDPQRSWVLYLGTSGGGVYKSESGSLTWEPRNTGLTSPYVFSLAVDPTTPATVYAGTFDGVFKSLDGAASWTRQSSGLPAGPVNALLIDAANARLVYASVQDAGLFRSADGGASWSAISGSMSVAGAMPLLINRQQPRQLFAGTSLQGVHRSDDAGATWTQSSFGMTLFVRGLAIDPSTPSTLYAGSLGAGVFKSTNGGGGWTNVGLRDRNVFKLAIDPQNPQTVYAATSRGLSRTADGGASWRSLGQRAAFVHAMAVDPRQRNRVFIGTTAGSVYRSTDGGETWEPAGSGLPPYTVFALAIDPADGTLYASPERRGVWRSTNDGASWVQLPLSPLNDAFISSLAVGAAREVYAGSVGSGVFRYASGSWALASTGLASPQVADIEALGNGVLLAATHDAGAFRSETGGASWTWASSGLTTSGVTSFTVDPASAGRVYAATRDGVFRSDDGGQTWQAANAGMRGVNTWAVAVDPAVPGRLYAGTNGRGVFRSDDGGSTWAPAASGLVNLDVRVVAAGGSAGSVYAGSLGGGVSRTRDGAQTWHGAVTDDAVDSFVLAVVVNPVNPAIVYAGTAGRGVLKSRNGGIDWQPVSNGLGSLFVLTLLVDPQHPDTLYAGTADRGVFYTINGGTSWRPLNEGLFNHVVTSLAIAPRDSTRLYAGTEGGGVFTNQVMLPATSCSFAVSVGSVTLPSAAGDISIEVTADAGCPWGVESGADWLTVSGGAARTGSGTVTVAAAINIGNDARSGTIDIAGHAVVVVQEGLAKHFRLTVTRTGTGSGSVASDWIGIACGTDCEQLFTESLPVMLTADARPGSRFAGWSGDPDCTDGAVEMSADRMCIARFEENDDFDADGLPNLWEAQFGLDPAAAGGPDGPDGDPDADGRTNAQELEDGTHPRGFVTRYFATAMHSADARTIVDLFNTSAGDAHVLLRLVADTGARTSQYRLVAPLGRATVEPVPASGGGFAIILESDVALAAERTLATAAPHATESEAAQAARTRWFQAGGTARDGRRLTYTIFNPGLSPATVDVVHLPAGSPVAFRRHTVLPGARVVIDAAADASVPDGALAGVLSSDVPVVVDATGTSGSGDARLGSLASAAPGYLQYLAGGQTGPFVTSSVDLLNPTGEAANITLTYVLAGGGIAQRGHTVPPYAALSVDPAQDDALLAETTFGVIGHAGTPFVMTGTAWWPGSSGDWYEGAAAAAAGASGRRWAIAAGEVGGDDNSETEIFVSNVSARSGVVRLRLIFAEGDPLEREVELPAVARITLRVGQLFPEAAFRRFSAVVESAAIGGGTPPEIVVEHGSFTSPGGTPRAGGTRVPASPIP